MATARHRLSTEFGMSDNVDVLYGFADTLFAQYRYADCFAITSRYALFLVLFSTTLSMDNHQYPRKDEIPHRNTATPYRMHATPSKPPAKAFLART